MEYPEPGREPNENIAISHLPHPKLRPKIEDLRMAQPIRLSEGYIGLFYRKLSLPITWLLVQTPITANQISVFWTLLGLISVGLLATGNYWWTIVGALSLQITAVLDRVDGEVARYKDNLTLVGKFIDLTGHSLIKSSLLIGISLGLYRTQPSLWILLVGISGALGLIMGEYLRFYRSYILEQVGLTPKPRISSKNLLLKIIQKSENLWWTLGLFGTVLLGAVANAMLYVLIFYGITTPLWAMVVGRRIIRELRVKQGYVEKNELKCENAIRFIS
jgi:phosphatidylglycerophosphate synthase